MLKNQNDIEAERKRLNERAHVIHKYRDHCIAIYDHHGVQDASSDLREINAAMNVLDWMEEKAVLTV